MMKDPLLEAVEVTGFPVEAFLFLQRGLDATVRGVHGEADAEAEPGCRHIDGATLCRGLRDYALEQYGLLARLVLGAWGVRSCEDFGRIVFAMVDAGLMQKTEHDSMADFEGVFDFEEAFGQGIGLESMIASATEGAPPE